jgi:transposase-like protein
MKNTNTPMNASAPFCPNEACIARGKTGQGNIVIHERKRPRYRCKLCNKTFSARTGTLYEGLRTDEEMVTIVLALLSCGCPVQAIVYAYGLDERTVADWRDRAGIHSKKVHKEVIEQANLDLQHIQADEIWVKGCGNIFWMGLVIMVSTRLWIAGEVSKTRDKLFIDLLLQQARRCARALCAILVATDGLAAYPNSIKRAFREKLKEKPGRGRTKLVVWADLCIATVIKRTEKKRVVEVTRKMSHGDQKQAEELLKRSKGGEVFNTSFIERLNGTMRERMAVLTRKCRHAAHRLFALEAGMYLIGTTYNFCFPHHQLSKKEHMGFLCTPAMAAGLTDHIWSMNELLLYRVTPPPWVPPKLARTPHKKKGDGTLKQKNPKEAHASSQDYSTSQKRPRGRPRTRPLPDPSQPKRPRGRPRKPVMAEFITPVATPD